LCRTPIWFCECSPETATCSMFLAESVSELCVLADFKGTLNTTAAQDNINVIQRCTANFAFLQFKSRSETGPAFSSPAFSNPAFSVLHFPVLHFLVPLFSTLEIWSLIFRSYIFSRPLHFSKLVCAGEH